VELIKLQRERASLLDILKTAPANAPPLAHQEVKSAFALAWDALLPARVPL